MKSLIMVLVVGLICIMPSQSLGEYEVSDSKTTFDEEDAFMSGSTKSISVDQEIFESGQDFVSYNIGVKNTGETNLTNVTLYNHLQPGMYYLRSDSYPIRANSSLDPTIIRNSDGTTKSLAWHIGELETGDLEWIYVLFERYDATNDEKNAIEARAIAFNKPEREQFEAAVEGISAIATIYEYNSTVEDVKLFTIKNDTATPYRVWIENIVDAKLKDVVLNSTLPKNVIYCPNHDLPRPTVTCSNNTTGLVWSLGDFEAGSHRLIEFSVVCNDSVNGCPATKAEATGKMEIYQYNITVENKGRTRLTDVVLIDTLPERMHYLESVPSEPTIISNTDDGSTEMISWFLGDLETGAKTVVELYVTCLDDNCCLEENQVVANGNTSIVHKMPIPITSEIFNLGKCPSSVLDVGAAATGDQKEEDILILPEGNASELNGSGVNTSGGMNASAAFDLMSEMESPGN